MKNTKHLSFINHQPLIINHFSSYLLLTTLFFLAFLERTAFDLGPNIELVTAAMILSAYYMGGRYSLWLVLAILVTTDLVIGNTNIFLFTWSGFLIPALFATSAIFGVKNVFLRLNLKLKLIPLVSVGLISNLFFFTWTNFGVWQLTSMYPKNLAGLTLSYVNALPFFKAQLSSTLIFIPLLYTIIEAAMYFSKKYQPHFNLLQLSKKQVSK